MADHISVPVVEHDGYRWGALAYYGKDHEFTGEGFKCIDHKYTFRNEHRVRIYRIRKQVFWRIPTGIELDIGAVPQRRVQGNR
jgi:hypothetical protein